jgi:L-gulonolactone oxidase
LKIRKRKRWYNWIRNRQSDADVYQPERRDEIREAIGEAIRSRGPTRPLGKSYAWSSLVSTDGNMIDLSRFDRLLSVDTQAMTLEVEAGMTLRTLVDTASRFGMTVPSVPIFLGLSVGGAVAVGAHGSGQRFGTMSDAIVELTLVTADGTLRTLTRNDPELDAARVSLGALGVIYSVKLACEKAFTLRVERGFVSDGIIAELADVLSTYEFVELFWFLTEGKVWVELMSRTDAPAPRRDLAERALRHARDAFGQLVCATVLPASARLTPRLVSPILETLYGIVSPFNGFGSGYRSEVLSSRDAFHYIHNYAKCWDAEFCIEADPDRVIGFWSAVRDAISSAQRQGRYPVNLLIHARFIGESRAFLSPAHGRPSSCYLEVVTLAGTTGARAFLEEIQTLAERWQARPHWGKYFDESKISEIASLYPALENFKAVRRALDPHEAFSNALLSKL